jgi:hypothetical protein
MPSRSKCVVCSQTFHVSGHINTECFKCTSDILCIVDHRYSCAANADVEYTEGLEIGYRWYSAHADAPPPLFPFGHGIGYSQFEYTDLSASSTQCRFSVKNTGEVDGVEIAQL